MANFDLERKSSSNNIIMIGVDEAGRGSWAGPLVATASWIDFKDYKFSVSSLPEFTSFQIKVVFNGTNSAYPARLKDFRAIALAV